MFQIGQAATAQEVNITFDIPSSINSFVSLNYKIIEANNVNITRLVSGLDSTRPINCVFSNEPLIKDSYVVSMFRSYTLIPDIVNRTHVNIIKVIRKLNDNNVYHEFWYIFGVKKGRELPAVVKIKKIKINNSIYEKIKCYVSGNIPSDLMRAINVKLKNKNYLQALFVAHPVPNVDMGDVRLLTDDPNSTA
ncbi:ORF_7 [Adoxophyes orana granulovirus]|uniref:ADOR7 n=1 Tax=Adoxophyes orana granulovirus TaxID=170617 RepID=Q7TA08_GVAO|nr:ORF_7 [Adoxophyes orana granulovirus]AAP85644.1 ORF_7 [Adoxophyes orana granulovirus]AJA91647.1 ADOR7 [Adoxophyes orana granulovirus]